MTRIPIAVFFLLTIWSSVSYCEQPNIVLIMADDMGYTDIGCYGSEIETPTLDHLASNGLRFTQFYNTSRCCPTRASLLTGLYSHQAGIGLMTDDRGHDAYRGDLNNRCVTLAEVLKNAGYQTYMSGKWHVTRHSGPDAPNHNWPLQRGFDRFYGTITGAGSFYDPASLCRGNTFITPENDPEYQPTEFYYTDAISDQATRFIKEHNEIDRNKPFFMYVAYTSAHWPMHAPEESVAKYRGKYDGGFDPIRERRLKKAREVGVLESKWEMTKGEVDWEKVKHKEWDIRNMEVYAAMIDRMDEGIGKIISQLRHDKQLDNTIVIYLQDNGGCAEPFGRRNNAEQREKFDFKPFGPNDLQPQIWPPMQTRDGRWVQTGPAVMAGPEDSYVAYGKGWANVSNTPFSGYKHFSYEGGISTPFIVHWPAGIGESQRGKTVDFPSHLIDVMPTFVSAADAIYPSTFADESVQPMEGVSLLPSFSGKELKRTGGFGFEHHGNVAFRDGRWKIVSTFNKAKKKPRIWKLFDMQVDRTELNDLSLEFPEKKQELINKWQAWADRIGVQEWPFENGKKR